MITACLILFFIALIILSNKGEKYFKRKALEQEASDRYEADYRDRTLKALERMSDPTPAEEVKDVKENTLLENFLEGNKELEEKRKIREAMKNELGIY
jgi:hypothetical protein